MDREEAGAMTIRRVTRRGETRLVIDIHYRKPDSNQGRFRKDAQVQSLGAARTEERRLITLIAQHGEPFEPRPEGAAVLVDGCDPGRPMRFGEAVALFRSGKAITRLKPSTRKGYEEVLSTWLLPKFGERPLEEITFAEVTQLDAAMVRDGASPSRRGNVQIVLRSVLRAALDAGKLAAMPRLPPLPKKGRRVLIPLSVDQVEKILAVAPPSQQIAFALAAFAGLRAGEVRALRWTDVELDDGGTVEPGGTGACSWSGSPTPRGRQRPPNPGTSGRSRWPRGLLACFGRAGQSIDGGWCRRPRTGSHGASTVSTRR
ncbi:MAG TPA: site-specific integrase [Bacilli bacterium]|nr:site-specific integrase [Bacilli bacterium]